PGRLQLRHAAQPLHPRGVDQVLLGRLAGDPARTRIEDVLMDGVGDEAAPLIGPFGVLHRGESTPPARSARPGPSPRRVRSTREAALPVLEEAVSIDRRHRDGAHLVVALDAELDEIAGAPGPELLVELLLRGHGHTVDLQDAVALPEPGARGRPDRRELAHEEAGR